MFRLWETFGRSNRPVCSQRAPGAPPRGLQNETSVGSPPTLDSRPPFINAIIVSNKKKLHFDPGQIFYRREPFFSLRQMFGMKEAVAGCDFGEDLLRNSVFYEKSIVAIAIAPHQPIAFSLRKLDIGCKRRSAVVRHFGIVG